jgi:hypothetical protein
MQRDQQLDDPSAPISGKGHVDVSQSTSGDMEMGDAVSGGN